MITPVILCGGSGTRLWPVSRKSFPKQFTRFFGANSLFEDSITRMSGSHYQPPLIITGSDYRFVVSEQMKNMSAEDGRIMIEPEGRNTAPAVLAAALLLAKENPEQLMLVKPSDHLIDDVDAFTAAVMRGVDEAKKGQLVTFGIKPDKPETGYGYLEIPIADSEEVQALTRFVEKPDLKDAEKMLADGNYLWNAGIFLFSVEAIIEAFKTHTPELFEPVNASVENIQEDLNFLRLGEAAWRGAPSISIDYAVMEKADNLSVVPYADKWSDLGGWNAIWGESEKDNDNNASQGNATLIDCENSLVRSEDDRVEVVGIGLKNMIVVSTNDAVLVADKSKGQDIKLAVDQLKEKGSKQAVEFPRDNRPWGWYETLALSDRFQVKRIVVNPGAALSLQSHMHRSEHWIVVSGTAKVTVDDNVQLVSENQSVYIPLGAKHRMENPGKVPMILIEVQTGSYLGEDDIIRYEDIYSRGQGAKG